MDVSGVAGYSCNHNRGVGGNWMYGVPYGCSLSGFRMAEAFGTSQVGILVKFGIFNFHSVHKGS